MQPHSLLLCLLLQLPRTARASEAHGTDDGRGQLSIGADPRVMPKGVAWAGYYAGVEAQASGEWNETILPRVQDANFKSVLEIAPGAGRWAEIFHSRYHTQKYVGVDLNAPAIEVLRTQRFPTATYPQLSFFANDGSTLPMVPARSITFAFSYDSMVHFPPSAVANYLRELSRVLKPGGTAFLHHANMPLCTPSDPCRPKRICIQLPNGTVAHVRGFYGGVRSCGIPVQARKNPQARNAGTTCASVAALAASLGLRVTRQDIVPWGGSRSLRHDAWDPATPPPRLPPLGIVDCFSVLLKPRGKGGGGQF